MLIARKYQKTNIVEYVLYMWHVEELVRSMELDIKRIEEDIVNKFELPESVHGEFVAWYIDIISRMKSEEIEKRGHLEELKEIVSELQYLHHSLVTVFQDKTYQGLFAKSQPNIETVKERAQGHAKGEIDAAMQALFGVLLLKLQNKGVSHATQEAIKSISDMMAYLAKKYHEMKSGKLQFPKVMEN